MNDLVTLTNKLLEENGLSAKKSFGQNFLTNSQILDKIFESIDFENITNIVEIGPGLGFLTERLIALEKKLTVIEADRDMVNILKNRFIGLDIIEGDCRKVDYNQFDKKTTLFIGNLPYNITKDILEIFINFPSPTQFSFMVQKEVGDKLKYKEGNKTNCALGAFMALKGAFYSEVNVPRSSFTPAPKVESIFLNYKAINSVDIQNYKKLKQLFIHPNKTVQNNLKPLNINFPEDYKNLISLRPHQLKINDIDKLLTLI
ncbi:MAG TPA: ribosomal RNA small subunit methyltransferase A [Firmicutes bacterium]|nr:ribosomal RNA small subunit methyltransferase A [Bacillota bacterium]